MKQEALFYLAKKMKNEKIKYGKTAIVTCIPCWLSEKGNGFFSLRKEGGSLISTYAEFADAEDCSVFFAKDVCALIDGPLKEVLSKNEISERYLWTIGNALAKILEEDSLKGGALLEKAPKAINFAGSGAKSE